MKGTETVNTNTAPTMVDEDNVSMEAYIMST